MYIHIYIYSCLLYYVYVCVYDVIYISYDTCIYYTHIVVMCFMFAWWEFEIHGLDPSRFSPSVKKT